MMMVLALAAARLRRRPGRGLLTALGVALAAAALVATLAIRTLAGDLALRQAITDGRPATGRRPSAGRRPPRTCPPSTVRPGPPWPA